MARIIDPAAAERPTARVGGGIARLGARGPSEAPAQAQIQLGADIQAGAEEIFRAQKIEEDRINTLRAEDAFTKLRERQLDLTVSEGEGFARLKGADAVTKPIRKEYAKRFDDAEAQISSTLTNNAQRERFKARAGIARLQFEEEMLRHLAREGDVYAKEVYDGAVNQAQREAVGRWDSPNDIASSLARIRALVQGRAERYGWSNEYREAVMQEEAGKIHSAVIEQALASGDFRYAESWYKAYKDQVSLPTAKLLQRAVEDGTQKELAASFNGQFLSQRENRAGLRALERTVLESPLDETRKNIIHGRILNRLDALDLRDERLRLQQERTIGKLITDANSNTLAGMPSTIEQLAPIYEAAKGTPLEPEAKQMVAVANATGAFASLTPREQAQAITGAEATIREDPTKFDRQLLEAWKSIHTSQQTQLANDPVTFAVSRGLAEPMALDLSQPVQAAPALAQRFALTRSLQAKYGSPNRPLTEPEAKLVSSAIEGAGWKERRDYLGQLFQASRGDVQGYSGIMSQIAQDHPVTAVAGEYTAKGRGRAAELMLAGEAILRPGTKADGKPDSSGLLPLPPEADMRAQFDDAVRDAYAGRPELRNVMYQATRAIYAKLASDAGVKDTKALDDDLWEQALALSTGGVEAHNGRRLPMPYGMDSGTFRDQVRRRTEDMQAAGALPEGLTAAQLQVLPLEPIGDGRYVFRTGTGVLVNPGKEGTAARPIVLDFNQSASFRPSGYGRSAAEQSEFDRWMAETGGKLGRGENVDQAIERWRTKGNPSTLRGINATKPLASKAKPKSKQEPRGVRG